MQKVFLILLLAINCLAGRGDGIGHSRDGTSEIRLPDYTGNLYETLNRSDRRYAAGGRLVKTADWEYRYDDLGNLVRKRDIHGATWRYGWNGAGMLTYVRRPDNREITFRYDALGRRIEKRSGHRVTQWVWDGNVPLHEMRESHTPSYSEERGTFDIIAKDPVITWVFEEGTFVPAAKITGNEKLSIVSNYMGTPEAMYRDDGETVWNCELNSYGKVRNFKGKYKTDCPFRYQGQYEDAETGLYYNRFRYYDPDSGSYISQDPIRLNGGMSLYSYVGDTNSWIDPSGLARAGNTSFIGGSVHSGTVNPDNPGGIIVIQATGSHRGDKLAVYDATKNKDVWSDDYRLHHVSYNPDTNEMTMQIVDRKAHEGLSHEGGAKDFKDVTGFEYNTQEAIDEASRRRKQSLEC